MVGTVVEVLPLEGEPLPEDDVLLEDEPLEDVLLEDEPLLEDVLPDELLPDELLSDEALPDEEFPDEEVLELEAPEEDEAAPWVSEVSCVELPLPLPQAVSCIASMAVSTGRKRRRM